jgi:hypothetical protein
MFKTIVFGRLLSVALICFVLSWVSFISVFAIDEGSLKEGFITRLIEDIWVIFACPTLLIFPNYFLGSNFFWGIVINCVFYGFLVDRIAYFLNRNKQI